MSTGPAPFIPASSPAIAIIGGGPAGLMAAEMLLAQGHTVDLYEGKASVGRKFLLAGKGGLNITHAEAEEIFLQRYGRHREDLQPSLQNFPPTAIRDWMQTLGIDSFVGSSGKVFPRDMRAAPLLRAWLTRLRASGLRLHVRHRWLGWHPDGRLRLQTPAGEKYVAATATLLALGGGSWPQLGSDGSWMPLLRERGITLVDLQPANCGFRVDWSEHFRQRFAGQPLKNIQLCCAGSGGERLVRRGEAMLCSRGIEGGAVYALSAALREAIVAQGEARLEIDLLPDWSQERVQAEVSHPRGSRSLASHLQSRLGISGVKAGLLREVLEKDAMLDPQRLTATIKALPLRLTAPFPLEEAISSAGGVCFSELDAGLMLKKAPGVFCAGEMLDWEAPTGGYLLSACLATGRRAGAGLHAWLKAHSAGKG